MDLQILLGPLTDFAVLYEALVCNGSNTTFRLLIQVNHLLILQEAYSIIYSFTNLQLKSIIKIVKQKLPTSLVLVWVFRLTFSPPPPPPSSSSSSSHLQLFVSLRYRKRCGGGSFASM